MSEQITIKAIVSYTKYFSTNWSSVFFQENERPEHTFTAIGRLPELSSGQTLILTGVRKIHEKYGEQLDLLSFSSDELIKDEAVSPDIAFVEKVLTEDVKMDMTDNERNDIMRVLTSSFITGIGKAKANKLYNAFKGKTLGMIKSHPDKLHRISGFGASIADKIHSSYIENQGCIELRLLLDAEATDGQIRKIYEIYKDKSAHQIKTDPYRLIDDIDGFGFKKADKVARAYGITSDSPCRIKGAIIHILKEMSVDGHCFAYPPSILDHLAKYVGEFPAIAELAADSINSLKDEHRVIVENDGSVWPKALYQAEVIVANQIKDLCAVTSMKVPVTGEHAELALMNVRKSTGFELEEHQHKAVVFVYQHPLSVITGGPGTGKTTIIKAILHVWRKFSDMSSVVMMAPTGKAARRITEITGYQAYTIHQQTGNARSAESGKRPHIIPPEDVGMVIVDEGSMIDINVALMLFNHIQKGTRVVIIGDKDQLPSVGPGNFFWELCRASAVIPKYELKLSFRQHGSIATNAYRLNNGSGAFIQDDSFSFIQAKKAETKDAALDAYFQLVQEFGVKNVCLLSPMKQKGTACTSVFNKAIQQVINPAVSSKREINSRETLRVGDRVVCNKNNWEKNIANGDIGTIRDIDNLSITVVFDSGECATLVESEMSVLSLAYAMTIHKSQGSEYSGVVVVFAAEHWYMRQRNLLYTAVTRAKEKLWLVGDARAIAACIEKNDAPHRNTKLKERLQA